MSIAQTAGKALIEVEKTLFEINELLLIVNNETSCNSAMREADQQELEELIEQINKVADETSYRHKPLLDGSHGVRGVVNGDNLEFIDKNSLYDSLLVAPGAPPNASAAVCVPEPQ
mgnify:CR=1 FL=1